MSDHLPADLITRILLRLPVPALLRCRSVSKPWQALIDSPRFVKLQIAHSAATGKNAILFISEVDGDYAVSQYENGLRRGIAITPPAQTSRAVPGSGLAVLGSCNGLLCFARNWEEVILWNPATRKVYLMPYELFMKSLNTGVGIYSFGDGRPDMIYNHGHGFGYDPVSDDYKVVQIIQTFKPKVNSLQSLLAGYGVSSKSCFVKEFPYILFGSRQRGVFVGAAIHWTAARRGTVSDDLTSEIVIVGFDLALHEFREVPLPPPDHRDKDSFNLKLGELGKCLCVFADYKDEFVDVWTMKEYGVKESWSILFSVPYPELSCTNEINPLGFSVAAGGEVLLQLDGKRFVWCDLMKDPKKVAAAEEIPIHGLKGWMDAVVCFGSLVALKEEVKVVDKQPEKPGPGRKKKKKTTQRKKRDDFLASGFKLKL